MLIGDRCWFKENLNIGTRVDGIASQTNNSTVEKYCYNNDEAKCDTYGGLYQWNELMQYSTAEGARGICPEGWHIPTYADFESLINKVGGASEALSAEVSNGTNSSGFTALLNGTRYTDGHFGDMSIYTTIWSSRENSAANANYMDINKYPSQIGVRIMSNSKDYGFSARCVKN